MSTRKNPGVVDEAADVAADGSLETVDPVFDPDLDQVPADESEPADVADAVDSESDSTKVKKARNGPRSRFKIIGGSAAALVLAAAAVGVAGALGGSDASGLPETVTDPNVVLSALTEGGISCTGTAVSGQVATCNTTVAVRVFDSTPAAESYVSKLVKSPLTSSAIGWVRHGNVVVASPLTRTPEIAAALGEGSQIY